MYVFIISVVCALLLGGVHYAVYESVLEAALVGFLLFIAIDTGLRAIMGRPSWAVRLLGKRERKKVPSGAQGIIQ